MVLGGVLLGRVSLENVNWNRGVRKMTDSRGLSWEAQEVLQKIKSFNRLPGAGIPPDSIEHEGWQCEDC
jgi:hypothetical protein